MFDANDVDIICSRMDIPEIRRNIHICETNSAISKQWGEDFWEYFYNDLASCFKLALDILSADRPSVNYFTGKSVLNVNFIKNKNDIVTVADRYTKLKKIGGRFTGRCPIHEEKTPSFFIFPDKQTWHCFGACGRGGDVISLVMEIEKIDFKSALEMLS